MRRIEQAAYALLIAITAVRIGSTWRVFSQTIDELVSLLAGYLWLSGKPSINPEHPPLPRILEAFPLRRAGVQDGEEPDLRARRTPLECGASAPLSGPQLAAAPSAASCRF